MLYIREEWSSTKRDYVKKLITANEAREVLSGCYRNVDDLLTTSCYYRLMDGGIDISDKPLTVTGRMLDTNETRDILTADTFEQAIKEGRKARRKGEELLFAHNGETLYREIIAW